MPNSLFKFLTFTNNYSEKSMTWSGLPLNIASQYSSNYNNNNLVQSNSTQPSRKYRLDGHPKYASLSNYN
jgi:hypothetical protein